MAVLLLLVPACLAGGRLGWPGLLVFFLSAGAVVPLAAFIGTATELLAARVGARAGGLLNATFGNLPDLMVGVFGVQRGLIPLVKATIIGALISNSALIMGACCVIAGLRYGRPRFRRLEAGHHSVLMMLTLAAIAFPSVGAVVLCGGTGCASGTRGGPIQGASNGIAVVLLLAYLAYLAYGVFGLERVGEDGGTGSEEDRVMRERMTDARWPVGVSVAVLVGAALLLVPVTDVLTANVQHVTTSLGWSQVFIGLVIVANVGNVAEGYAAIRLAFQKPGRPQAGVDSGLDLALGIASASSIQIAALVAPLIVIYSLFATPMNLAFSMIEVTILALLALVFSFIAHDGESNWLEGAQLLALYGMAAVLFYALPEHAFG